MIKPEEIKKIALKLYVPFLKSWLKNESFFPQQIRGNKLLDKDFILASNQIEILFSDSKNKNGIGYCVHTKDINTKKMGTQSVPVQIEIESEDDFLYVVNKKEEFERFKTEINNIRASNINLNNWLVENPEKISENMGKWSVLLTICSFFLQNPKPIKYLRELPIDIHTKFIEENKSIIASILDFLIPDFINSEEKTFEKRYHLKFDIELKERIRLRFLDPNLYPYYCVSELVLLPYEFEKLDFKDKKIFITENKTNYLSFPNIENGIVIFGKGFALSALENAYWLSENQLYYWGDIDAHGYEILSQIRGYFDKTISILMDKPTFEANKNIAKKNGEYSNKYFLNNLSVEENSFFNYLNENRWRIEQEKLPYELILNFVSLLNLPTSSLV
ncbi:MAG: hypothetical protein EAZ53_13630 [Bacteroidetes bacterium]|nr:MAG: hypothetical protein EAZ53_13630 [Bacteroidota bacterium]